MSKKFEGFPINTLGVMLDALDYYLKTSEQRREELLQLIGKYEKRLDYFVVMAQLNTNMIDARDEANLTLALIEKKLELFEEYLKDATSLYYELFAYLKSENEIRKFVSERLK